MNRLGARLLFAGVAAFGLHGVLLFYQMPQRVIDPVSLPMQRISVSLGQRPRVQQVQEKPENPRKSEVVPQPPQAKLKPKPVQPRVVTKVEPVVPAAELQEVQKQQVMVTLEGELSPLELQVLPQEEPVVSESGMQKSTTELASHVVQQATPLYQINPPPKYPRLARRRSLEGVVLLEAFINDFGRVEELKVFTTSGHKVLDRAALKAVWRWQFQPGTRDGLPHPMWVKVPVRFQLQESF